MIFWVFVFCLLCWKYCFLAPWGVLGCLHFLGRGFQLCVSLFDLLLNFISCLIFFFLYLLVFALISCFVGARWVEFSAVPCRVVVN